LNENKWPATTTITATAIIIVVLGFDYRAKKERKMHFW